MGTTATTRSAERGGADTWPRRALHRAVTGLRAHPYRVDILVGLGFVLLAAWLGQGFWPDPATRELALNPTDQILIEWFLAVDTRVLLGEHGLLTDRLNVPDGMNLVANATSLTLGFLLAPVTLTLGAPVSFALLTIGNLAGTAVAWYLLFARTLFARTLFAHTLVDRSVAAHRAIAAVGGGFCGFAPAMVSHSNSHWHMTAQWLVPAIIWALVRLARAAAAGDRRRLLTSAPVLAGLVVAQYFLGAEVLYLTAVALLPFTIVYAVVRRDWSRRVAGGFLAGLAVAVGVASLLLAYPLWMQFFGPGSVPDGPFDPGYYFADLASWAAFSPLTVAGSDAAADLATGPAEYNTFLGWPLLLVAAGCAVWLRRQPLALAATIAAAVMALLSLGPELVVDRNRTGVPLPYLLLVDRPVVDGALPQRYAVAVVPLVALVLVLALERARTAPLPQPRVVVPALVGLALLPLWPTPLPATDREPVPAFITDGHWRDCVAPGGVLVPVPLPTPSRPEPMRWAAATAAGFALPEGFFIGPYGRGGRASMGVYPQPTSRLLADVAATGQVPEIGAELRAQAARDLAHWDAECVVLGPDQPHQDSLHATLESLLDRPGERVADAWIWRV